MTVLHSQPIEKSTSKIANAERLAKDEDFLNTHPNANIERLAKDEDLLNKIHDDSDEATAANTDLCPYLLPVLLDEGTHS
eukprot:CAMPEP_0113967706 /NCGR_PEP_ID=MMETSP0011_2-20120614/9093_1 /TAXON_ID=101924 /ORGANISM="Rhodosorus marinus" /LENGTH=79 /DNA_ID=CAMNT_0000980647 /DNA_START=310 /DNA_END=546 /DNA_ORIENTATION=+ /assembly_acc=CAM_ASM_000156